eukprot:gene15507-21596_t
MSKLAVFNRGGAGLWWLIKLDQKYVSTVSHLKKKTGRKLKQFQALRVAIQKRAAQVKQFAAEVASSWGTNFVGGDHKNPVLAELATE